MAKMAQRQDETIRATIAGSSFTLDRALVEERLEKVLPEPVADHYVVVGGRRFPPKQVIALVTGLDRADFTTHQVRRILRKLGFSLGRRSAAAVAPHPERPLPDGGAGAEALRPYIGKWVALKGIDVLVAADTPEEVVAWLERHDVYADGMFRVPRTAAEAEGAGPF
jgi:hypothetical protein